MNLLLDFCTLSVKTGAAEYMRRIYAELLRNYGKTQNVKLFALYDSSKGIAYEDMLNGNISSLYHITYVDVNEKNLAEITRQYSIDRFFIGCQPYVSDYPGFEDIECEVIIVVHDICYKEMTLNNIYDYMSIIDEETRSPRHFSIELLNRLNFKRHAFYLGQTILTRHSSEYGRAIKSFDNVVSLLSKNSKARIVVVSNYTKNSILYNYNIPSKKIQVLYSPGRIYVGNNEKIENPILAKLISESQPYFLLVSAYRSAKNPIKAVLAFERLRHYNKRIKLAAIGYNGPVTDDGVVSLPFLSDNDLMEAYKHCYSLVYPSFFEGFGYPPLEAMQFGKPVLCANVTSMPEILGDAPIYFSPFYESDIFSAMNILLTGDYETYSQRSLERYRLISERQERDLSVMVEMLIK